MRLRFKASSFPAFKRCGRRVLLATLDTVAIESRFTTPFLPITDTGRRRFLSLLVADAERAWLARWLAGVSLTLVAFWPVKISRLEWPDGRWLGDLLVGVRVPPWVCSFFGRRSAFAGLPLRRESGAFGPRVVLDAIGFVRLPDEDLLVAALPGGFAARGLATPVPLRS